ncbi:MAG: hypothetical protein IJS14_06035 [Lentisphaeria bacterium]|nr:hypothetical protein [Lentisphaeria bacterium]
MRRFISLTLLAAAGLVYAQEAPEGTAAGEMKKEKAAPRDRITTPEYKVSNQRIDAITAVIQKYYDERAKLDTPEVVTQIKEDIAKIVPVQPADKADVRSQFQIREDLKPQVDKKFPVAVDKIRAEADAEAAKKYPMAKRGETVTIYTKRAGSITKIKGNYYGFGIGKTSIRINSRNISYFDLTPESKSMFDQNVNAEIRKEYVNQKVGDYLTARQKYATQLLNAEVTRVRLANEKLGYLYRRGKWEPAEIFVNEQLKIMTAKAKARDEAERLEKERQAKENPNRNNGEQGNNENNGEQGNNENNNAEENKDEA